MKWIRNYKKIRTVLGFVCFICFVAPLLPAMRVEATAGEKYGILIGDKAGKYIFYDLNGGEGTQSIEKNKAGCIMIPLKKVCSYLPTLNYKFDFTTQKATIQNEVTKKQIVFEIGKSYAMIKDKQGKTSKVKLSQATYISKGSNAAMVHSLALRYILGQSKGYKFYKNAEIKEAGYDCEDYQGVIVYQPYGKVKSLPKATKVTYYADKSAANIVKVTIPEGYSVPQVINRLVSKGVCVSSDVLYGAMDEFDCSQFPVFLNRLENKNRCYKLEGYLFPDTYEFYKNSNGIDVLTKILKNTQQKLQGYEEQSISKGYTLDDIITLASIIEKEAGIHEEMPNVSSVLNNRLKQGMRLQCDAAIYYVERYIKPNITGDINRYNKYYNTNKCKALPAGAICNPGKKAIKAALNPNETEYLFFFSDPQGTYYYSRTLQEHEAKYKVAYNITDESQESENTSKKIIED